VNPSVILAILRRELRDVLRDRRTLITNFVMPIVFYPLLMIGMATLGKAERDRLDSTTLPVVVREEGRVLAAFDPASPSGGFAARLAEDKRLVPTSPADPDAALKSGDVLAIIDVPGDLAKRVREGVATDVAVTLFTSDPLSGEVSDAVERAVTAYRGGIAPLNRKVVDLSPPNERGAAILGGILGIILVTFALSATLLPAIDLVAGEKERGTLEALLISPASRTDIVLGKFLTVLVVATASTAVSLGSLAFSMNSMLSGLDTAVPVEISMTPLQFASIFLALVLVASLFAALGLAVSAFARSFKEAQTWLGPLMFVSFPLCFLAMPQTATLHAFACVPLTNVALLVKDMLRGQAQAFDVALVIVEMSVLAAVALAWTISLFRREDVIFREGGVPLFRRDETRRTPPATAALLAVFAAFVVGLQAGPKLLAWHPAAAIVGSQVAFFLAGVVLWKATTASGIGWIGSKPAARHVGAGVCIGLGGLLFNAQMHALRSAWFPGSSGLEDVLSKALESVVSLGVPMAFLLIAVLPGIAEETLFRGSVQPAFGTRRRWVGIVVSAVAFGVIHIVPEQILSATILGLLLGWLRASTGSLIPCMVAHVVNNGLTVLAATAAPGLAPAVGDGAFPGLSGATTRAVCLAVSAVLLAAGVGLARARVAPAPRDG